MIHPPAVPRLRNQQNLIAGLKAEAGFIKKTREAEMNAELVNIQRKIAKAEAKV